jgi:hypothetical protein
MPLTMIMGDGSPARSPDCGTGGATNHRRDNHVVRHGDLQPNNFVAEVHDRMGRKARGARRTGFGEVQWSERFSDWRVNVGTAGWQPATTGKADAVDFAGF